jgi:hypothetical protein
MTFTIKNETSNKSNFFKSYSHESLWTTRIPYIYRKPTIKDLIVRFEVSTAVTMMIIIF